MLTCRRETRGTTEVVAVAGEIDPSTVATVTREAHRAIEAAPELVVLDLGEVTFLDSAALHAASDLVEHAAARGVRLILLPAPAPVHEPFVIAGLDAALPFAEEVLR